MNPKEAARKYATLPMDVGEGKVCIDRRKCDAFIAGAEWHKNALLEWAKEQSASCDGAGAMKRAYDKLIEKLNSL